MRNFQSDPARIFGGLFEMGVCDGVRTVILSASILIWARYLSYFEDLQRSSGTNSCPLFESTQHQADHDDDNGRYLLFQPSQEGDRWRFGKLSLCSIDQTLNKVDWRTFYRSIRSKTGQESDQQVQIRVSSRIFKAEVQIIKNDDMTTVRIVFSSRIDQYHHCNQNI